MSLTVTGSKTKSTCTRTGLDLCETWVSSEPTVFRIEVSVFESSGGKTSGRVADCPRTQATKRSTDVQKVTNCEAVGSLRFSPVFMVLDRKSPAAECRDVHHLRKDAAVNRFCYVEMS